MASGGYLLSDEVARYISSNLATTKVNSCFSIYLTQWGNEAQKMTQTHLFLQRLQPIHA